MDVFFTGFITLLIFSAICYVVLFSFIYYWHLNWKSYIIVPVIFTFEIFLKGFIALAIISIIFYYAPYLINISGL
jgi:hypothetical protein